MSVEPGIIDANVLVYAMDADAPQHAASRAFLDAARDGAFTLTEICRRTRLPVVLDHMGRLAPGSPSPLFQLLAAHGLTAPAPGSKPEPERKRCSSSP